MATAIRSSPGDARPGVFSANPASNCLLAAMIQREKALGEALITPLLRTRSLKSGEVLYNPGDEIEYIHFPHSGLISLRAILIDGKMLETAIVGSEGAVGGMAGLGPKIALTQAVVETPSIVSSVEAHSFRRVAGQNDGLCPFLLLHTQMLLVEIQVNGVCNAFHSVRQRFARWILERADRLHEEEVAFTHEHFSTLLGVRRSSVTEAARLQKIRGSVNYSRGRIVILDRNRLELEACECYAALKGHLKRLSGNAGAVTTSPSANKFAFAPKPAIPG